MSRGGQYYNVDHIQKQLKPATIVRWRHLLSVISNWTISNPSSEDSLEGGLDLHALLDSQPLP